jgi:iduronate 2-sulfatase
MFKALPILFLGLISLTSVAAQQPNVLLICIDDLRPELKCFGADYIHSPNIDKIAAQGRAFNQHYSNAPTCGASRYTLLTGRYGSAGNNALFQRAKDLKKSPNSITPSMPEWFRQHGYTTVSVGKVSHHPGGRGGANWDDATQIEMPGAWDRHLMPSGAWQHPRGIMHGLANGNIREKSNEHNLLEAFDGDDSSYPDGLITAEAIAQLSQLANAEQPFFLAVGLIRPHLPFGAPKKYLDLYADVELPPIPHPQKPSHQTTWHGSGEFMQYNRGQRDPRTDAEFADTVRRHYAACVSYADAQVGKILDQLKSTGQADNTITLIWGDHGWHLGEHSIWGKHALFEESLHSPLIIHTSDMPKPGKQSAAIVETIDIFPTLCDLTGLDQPDFTVGRSLLPQIQDPQAKGHTAIAYTGRAQTIRTENHRLTLHKNGTTELYDHRQPDAETTNLAAGQPEVVTQLSALLKERIR